MNNIDLKSEQVKLLPCDVDQFYYVTSIYANSQCLEKVADEIYNMINLINLWLSYSKISVISNKISNLVNLKTLSFEENNISEVPEEISNLKNLCLLSFSKNYIKKLPEGIARLSNLRTFYIYSNPVCNNLPIFDINVEIIK